MSFPILKLLFSTGILVAGIVLGWLYLHNPAVPLDLRGRRLADQRPWRRLGGAICLVLAVMFVIGVYAVDVPDHPRVYLAYWTVMMGLVIWLCLLATKDILYTREVISSRRRRRGRPGGQVSAEGVAGKGPER